MEVNMSKHLAPSLSNTGHVIASGTGKKRKGFQEGSIPSQDLKKIYKPLTDTMTLQLILMERLKTLVHNLPLDTQQVDRLVSGSLRSLELDCYSSTTCPASSSVQQLQLASVMLLTAVFRRYPAQREAIMEGILSLVPSLPVSKRSLRTFPVSYASATCPSALHDFNCRVVGNLLSHQSSFIQMVTSLVLSLVQSCVTTPIFDDDPQKFQSGLRTCQSVSDSFIAHLLRRCTKVNSGASVDSFRTFLSNFTEDLLLVFLVPEYPATKLLLSSIEKFLKMHLSKATRVFGNEQQAFETTYLNSAFDTLGKICSVKAGILASSRQRPVTLTLTPPMSLDTECNEAVDCHCGNPRMDVFLVGCDSCHKFFHGACVGISDKESVPEKWSCDACCLGRIVIRERNKHSPKEQEFIDKSYVLHHSVRAMTSHRLGVDMKDAIRIGLVSWVEHLEQSSRLMRRTAASLLEYWDKPGPAGENLTEEGVCRVVLALAAEGLPKSIRSQIGFVLKILGDPSNSSLRKLSLRVIDQVVKGDQTTMMIPVVALKVSERLGDDSISVREAAVALVGDYIARCPGAIKRYGNALVQCLEDPGVSVRKRAVRIFEHVLRNCPEYPGQNKVCSIMLQRAADPKEEDGVRDLIDDLFASLWLSNSSGGPGRKRSISETEQIVRIPGVVTPTTPIRARKRPLKKSDAAAEQMMEVVKFTESGDVLEAMLKKLLLSGAVESDSTRKQTERKQRQEMGLDQCVELVASLFELLVVVDEQREFRPTVGRDIAATLGALVVFASVCPHQLLVHIDTLMPYIKADNGVSFEDEGLIVSSACKMISRLVPVLDRSMMEKLSASSLAKDLGKICYRFGSVAIDHALEAFSALASHDAGVGHFKAKLLGLAKVFLDFLVKKKSITDISTASVRY